MARRVIKQVEQGWSRREIANNLKGQGFPDINLFDGIWEKFYELMGKVNQEYEEIA